MESELNVKYQLLKCIEDNGSINELKGIIRSLKTLNFDCLYERYDYYVSPLLVAINNKNFEIASYLIKRGADINYKNGFIFEYLYTMKLVDKENLKFLLNNGLNINSELFKKIMDAWICDIDRAEVLGILLLHFISNQSSNSKMFKRKKKRNVEEKEISIENMFQIIINIRNYGVFESIIKYVDGRNDSKEELIDMICGMLYNNDRKYQENRKKEFINSLNLSNNKYLELKIKNRFLFYDLMLAKDNVEKFQQIIEENNIVFRDLRSKYFDLLIFAIKYKMNEKVLKYIVNTYHDTFFNYYIVDELTKNNYYAPLFSVLARNDFSTAKVLLDRGASINYCVNNVDILTYLYTRKLLNFKNLKFILENGYDINENDTDNIIFEWINHYMNFVKEDDYSFDVEELIFKRSNRDGRDDDDDNEIYLKNVNSFLEIFLKYWKNNSEELVIKDEYYQYAIDYRNINAYIILLNNDKRKMNDILNMSMIYFDVSGRIDFLTLLDRQRNFQTLDFYYNKENEKGYIDKRKFKGIKQHIIDYINKLYSVTRTIKNWNLEYLKLDDFIQRITENKVEFDLVNNSYFDILIYAIKNRARLQIIAYIINQYKTLNYTVNNTPVPKTPLIAALKMNNFDIADLLIKHGADINYRENFVLHREINLNIINLKYILDHGYVVNSVEDYNDFLKNILSNIKEINFDHLEFMEVLFNNNSNNNKYPINNDVYIAAMNRKDFKEAILMLVDHDIRNKNEILFLVLRELEFKRHGEKQKFLKFIYEEKGRFDLRIVIRNYYRVFDNWHDVLRDLDEYFDEDENEKKRCNGEIEIFGLNNISFFNFDALIYAIENDYPKKVIEYIVDHTGYETLDYYKENIHLVETPLSVALIQQSFDIADLLIRKGASINYEYTDKALSSYYLYNDFDEINYEQINYLEKKGYSQVAKYCINVGLKENDVLLNKNLNNLIFRNNFYHSVKTLLVIYKNKEALSDKRLQEIVSEQVSSIITDEVYELAMTQKNDKEKILKVLLSYEVDRKKKNKIISFLNKQRRPTMKKRKKGKKRKYDEILE
ncbi:hypothetical protein PIROE2DRAFT_59338 [Piromyces sp. E2]|nr:hypothetical protein PIROE2DRAFT_59338 [Piromyces sp. E2]|eukprot:OUM66528.1 hypothetical protein PIROE2DRAFT_59338 [Piromyces sp. E2]